MFLKWEFVITAHFEMDAIWTDFMLLMLVPPALAGLSFFLQLQPISDLFVRSLFMSIEGVE
jgi:hypothetical protein